MSTKPGQLQSITDQVIAGLAVAIILGIALYVWNRMASMVEAIEWSLGIGLAVFLVLNQLAFRRRMRAVERWANGRYFVAFWAWLDTDAGRELRGIAQSSPDGLIGAWEEWNRWKEGQRAKT